MYRKSNFGILLVVIFIPLLLVAIYLAREGNVFPFDTGEMDKETVRIGNVSISATLALTVEERRKGLSGTTILPANDGMLFVFPESGFHGIWMKDMIIPIDIIWIGEDLRVVDIEANVFPDSYPTIFYPKEPARYVLEVNALFAESRGIQVGDFAELPSGLKTAALELAP